MRNQGRPGWPERRWWVSLLAIRGLNLAFGSGEPLKGKWQRTLCPPLRLHASPPSSELNFFSCPLLPTLPGNAVPQAVAAVAPTRTAGPSSYQLTFLSRLSLEASANLPNWFKDSALLPLKVLFTLEFKSFLANLARQEPCRAEPSADPCTSMLTARPVLPELARGMFRNP